MIHWLAWYWDWAGSNVGAMPACGAIGLAAGFLARNWIGKRLAAWWARHHGPHAIAQHLEALRQYEERKAGR